MEMQANALEQEMGQLIDFRQAGERAVRLRPKSAGRSMETSRAASAKGKVLLFTGVRYERMDNEDTRPGKRLPGRLN